MAGKAILVLERPWWTPYDNPRRASVLPFFQGLSNFLENFSVYHSNFYGREGFRMALEDDLTFTREDRLYLYIASHGSGKMIGGSEIYHGMKLSTMLSEFDKVASYRNIEGVIIGSCEIGCNVDDLLETPIGNRIVWIFGYKSEIDWVGSMMVDLSIFESLTKLRESDLEHREKIINAFVRALEKFDGNYKIGENDDGKVALKDAVTLIILPRGRGNKPRDDTVSLIEKLRW
jgi:hypothetical protein